MRRLRTRLKTVGITNLYACACDPGDEADAYLSGDSERFLSSLGFEKVGTLHRRGRKLGRL